MPDVMVVGAGLAGTGLAAAMARRGWQVTLVERRPLPGHKVCGEFLSPEAHGSLIALGLHEAVGRLAPVPIAEGRLISPGGLELVLSMPGQAWGVSRYSLDQALLTAAREAGAEVRTQVSATHISPLPGQGYSVAVDGTWVSTRAAVGAWGRQTVPALRAHHPPPQKRAWIGLKQHYEGLVRRQVVELYLVPGGYVGLAPVEGDRYNCAALINHQRFRQVGASLDGFFHWAGEQNRSLGLRLTGGTPVTGSEVTISGVDTGQRPRPWSVLPLVGDAVAVIPPLVGDGMAMALRSAELLAPLLDEHLKGRLSRPELAAAYTRAYNQEFSRRLRVARWLQRGLVQPLAAEALLRLGCMTPWLAGQLLLATRGAAVGGASPASR